MPQGLGDVRTDGRTDGRTDECNSICLPLCGGIKRISLVQSILAIPFNNAQGSSL
jgi:hypothetical protein